MPMEGKEEQLIHPSTHPPICIFSSCTHASSSSFPHPNNHTQQRHDHLGVRLPARRLQHSPRGTYVRADCLSLPTCPLSRRLPYLSSLSFTPTSSTHPPTRSVVVSPLSLSPHIPNHQLNSSLSSLLSPSSRPRKSSTHPPIHSLLVPPLSPSTQPNPPTHSTFPIPGQVLQVCPEPFLCGRDAGRGPCPPGPGPRP